PGKSGRWSRKATVRASSYTTWAGRSPLITRQNRHAVVPAATGAPPARSRSSHFDAIVEVAGRGGRQPRSRETARRRKARMESVGEISIGQTSVQLPWPWQRTDR